MISIIIVNHNTGEILHECLNSIRQHEASDNYEIIIVDNFSGDASREIIKKAADEYEIKYIFTDSLLSFSAANNLGIMHAKSENILIMNPDIIFTEPVLQKLELLLNGKTGAVSPALTGTDGNFQRNYFQRYPTIRQFIFYYSIFSKMFNRSQKRMNKYLENQDIDISTGKAYEVEQIPFAFYMTSKAVLDETGGLDEKFILFFEDVDLSYRTAKNYKLLVDTSVKVTHLGGSSFKTAENWWLHGRFIASMLYFFRKHYSPARAMFLSVMVRVNSYLITASEKLLNVIGKGNSYRLKKHQYLLKAVKT